MKYGPEIKAMVRGNCKLNEPMSRHTTYGIGGPAGALIAPADKQDLDIVLRFARTNNIGVFLTGSGSNLLVADDGFDGIVISLRKTFKSLLFYRNRVYAEAGVMLGHLVRETSKRNLSGLESLIGIPGTLGGALIMNAGAFGSEISRYLVAVNTITHSGKAKRLTVNKISFDYRQSSFKSEDIIVSAEFNLRESTVKEIHSRQVKASKDRKKSQPLQFRSAGSVFKNPRKDLAAGYLIDQAGLKGAVSGDAEISTKHANFFINRGKAKAEDIVKLIRLAKDKVYKKFGIMLELEIKTLGFDSGTFG